MVTKKRARELNAPDQFQSKAAHIMDWALLNKNQLIGVGVGLVVVILALFGYDHFKVSQKDTRIERLGEIQMQFDKETNITNDEADALRKTMAIVKPIDEKLPAAEKAKIEAENNNIDEANAIIEAKIETLKPDHSESRDAFAAFAKENLANAEGWMAGVTAANLHIEGGNTAKGKELLQLVIDNSKKAEFYQVHSRLILVGLLEDEKKFDEAIAQINELEELVGKDLKPRVLLAKAKALMLKKAGEEAHLTLTQLIKDYGSSPEAKEAKSIKALLN